MCIRDSLIAITLHEHSYRDRENKVSQPISGLRKRGLEGVQFTGFHQLPDHCGKQIAADRPQEEKAENQCERNGICILFHVYSDCLAV